MWPFKREPMTADQAREVSARWAPRWAAWDGWRERRWKRKMLRRALYEIRTDAIMGRRSTLVDGRLIRELEALGFVLEQRDPWGGWTATW